MTHSIIKTLRDKINSHNLSKNIGYTLCSFMILAISGIIINVVITALRDPAALGVFNLSYAVYIIASQFAAFGLHYSVLRYSAYYKDDETARGKLLCTAAVCSVFLGIIVAALIYMGQPLFHILFKSETVAKAIGFSAFGLVIFPLNKILLAYLNGITEMKAFSVLQGVRYFIVMLVVSLFAASALPIEYTTLSFCVAELFTVFSAIIYISVKKLVGPLVFDSEWAGRHFVFGAKALMAGMFAEVNSRLDVLVIGFYLSDFDVGIYSFAAMLADGLYHVLAMMRINFNPLLVTIIREKQWSGAKQLRAQSGKYVVPIMAVLSILILAAYYIFSFWVSPAKGLEYGLPSLIILLLGLVSVSFLVPFDNLLLVSGYPGYQTAQQITMVGSNLLSALLLVPVMGIKGAAIATVIGYVVGIAVLVLFAKRLVGWRLLTNTYAEVN